RLALSADNHNSMNGIVEYARRRGATTITLPLDASLRLDEPHEALRSRPVSGPSLLGYPAQSNFSGVRHPFSLVGAAQRLGYRVLLDAAAFVPTSPLSLREVRPDFVALSLYKLFGFPTGVGALVARRDAISQLARPYFAGGTVDWVSVQHRAHQLRAGPGAFEDGTPNFYGLAAAHAGFDLLARVDMHALSARVTQLAALARREMQRAAHANGAPMFRVYSPEDGCDLGGTLAVNVLDARGIPIPYELVETAARDHRVAVRGGCFCNPGAAEAAFGFRAESTRRCLRTLGRDFTPRRLGDCLNDGTAVGAIRLSFGLATSEDDVVRGATALANTYTAR
ncbi:MAG TPA: aminotransferase class V-fold PLP-dependent enzyme, partial [Gemmatimonadaceae bacterium]|nr:aminotransferase class V-fold PLP-dependent enzyme [Gemmatimonadaceae bacterium]